MTKSKMGHCVLVGLVMLALSQSVMGQTCPATVPTECYFTGAATRASGVSTPNGYFAIGGLFDVHERGQTAYSCSSTISKMGIMNVLAFFWAVDKYSSQFTSQVAVGAVAFDNCMRPEQTLENILGFAQCNKHIQGFEKENLLAYVGPYMNEDAKWAGTLAQDLNMTLVSPTANALGLNIGQQKSLLRLSPSFEHELDAVVHFLKEVNSKFVAILYSSEDIFWFHAYEHLEQKMGDDICASYAMDYDSKSLDNLVDDLDKRISLVYIVPLMSKSKLMQLMQKMQSEKSARFTFIVTSMIGRDFFLGTAGTVGNNTIVIDKAEMKEGDFYTFITNINSNINTSISSPVLSNVDAPWIAEYLGIHGRFPNETDLPSPMRYSVYQTIQAVRGILQGLDKAIGSICRSSTNLCNQLRNLEIKNENIFIAIRDELKLNSTSKVPVDAETEFIYYNFVTSSSGTQQTFNPVGTYGPRGSTLDVTALQNPTLYSDAFAVSVCPQASKDDNLCCETPTTIAMPTTTTASDSSSGSGMSKYVLVMYPRGQDITGAYSDDDRDDSDDDTRFDLGHKWIIALGVLAGLGILCVIVFEIYILYKLLGTRVGSKWRTMWLGQLLLFGIFLSYLVLFAYLPVPTKATCGITRFGVGVSYAVCFAVLLVKLMVILTSKPSDVLLPGDIETPNYLKGIYQFLMFIFAVGVQVVIDVQWLITVPPEAIRVKSNTGDYVWICNHYTWEAGGQMKDMRTFVRSNFENHLMSLIYIMVMILITTILALRSHGIITNHRESVFIGIAAGFSIPIWLAWGLVGGLNDDHDYAHEFGDACIAFGLLLTATLILFAMFLPKVRQLVNMGVEGIYLEDDRETYYGGGSVIMAPPSFKSKGPGSVIYVNSPGIYNNPGIYSEPVIIGNGDPMATHLKHPGSVYSAPAYIKKPDSTYGGSTRVLRVTDDLRGHHPKRRSQSEVAYGSSGRPRSTKGTLPRARSQTNLGAL